MAIRPCLVETRKMVARRLFDMALYPKAKGEKANIHRTPVGREL
ncbi:MAG: hypothetical protein ABL862_09730 [Candidatus Nitrotoga sp.]